MSLAIISRADAKAKGLQRYFTGEPCIHGHVSERQTINKNCVDCSRLQRLKKAEELASKGLKRLPPNGICERGHYAERYSCNGRCVVCHREDRKRRYQEFREANPLPPAPPKKVEALASEIRAQGMTLEQFSLKMGWTKQTLSLWRSRSEKGRNPWIDELASAWGALGFALVAVPIEDASRIDRESYGNYPSQPLNCHPIVARIFFEQERIGWSRKKLAKKVGIHYNTLNRMATGESRAKAENVEACLNAMGLTLTPRRFNRSIKNNLPLGARRAA
jgi:transcriptional regulator with XRE-family HTH domain